MGRRLAQVADELDAEIDRQAGIITRSEVVPASDVRLGLRRRGPRSIPSRAGSPYCRIRTDAGVGDAIAHLDPETWHHKFPVRHRWWQVSGQASLTGMASRARARIAQ